MAENFTRGSEWRKWDLQIHTPYSHLSNGFGNDWDNYVKELFKKAIANGVSAIGITDYFTIEGYKKLKTEYLEKPDKLRELFNEAEITAISKILVLPNIEFRLNKFVGQSRINFHVLLSNEISLTDIEENFLHDLEFTYEAAPQTADELRKLKLTNLEQLGKKLIEEHEKFKDKPELFIGMMNAVVDDKQICDLLVNKKNIFEGKYLIAIPSDEDLSNVPWNGQDHLARKLLIQKSNILIAANPNTIQWALGKKHTKPEDFISEFKGLKACIGGSDAHAFHELFTKNGDRQVWIKADLTWEGLKEITYEPEERVRIQKENPAFDFEKSIFTEIEITKPIKIFSDSQLAFEKCTLPLNQNLVAIIGGRGTGKSILVNYISNGFKHFTQSDDESAFNLQPDFKIKWKRTQTASEDTFSFDMQHDLQYLFISQSEVKEKVKSPISLGIEIRKILELENLSFNLKTDETIQNYLNEFRANESWFEKTDETNNPINRKSFVQSEIQKNKSFLERITTEETKEKLTRYSTNVEKIQKSIGDKELLEQLKKSLTDFEITSNLRITELNKGIPTVSFKLQIDAINLAISKEDADISQAQNENALIKDEFKDYKGDLTTLLSSVERFSGTIITLERRLKEIEEKEKQLQVATKNKNKIAGEIKAEYEEQKKKIDDSWSNLLKGKADWNAEQKELMKLIIDQRKIKIEGEYFFDKKKFYELLSSQLDGRVVKGKNDLTVMENIFGVKNFATFVELLEKNFAKVIADNPSYFPKYTVEAIEKILYDIHSRASYLTVQPKITFDGKPLDKISVGQRGTIYLCLKLATNIFSQTIVFDQPEDDLDNNFIFEDLIRIFKDIKKYRQVIIVTHNANLVVNADAEQVIVASNEDERLSYKAGSLENPDINNEVCHILEGGRIAFQQRKNKYNLN